MKVQRYTYGKSNVGLLQSQRSSAITPAEGAAAAAVPYEAIAGAAEDISADLLKLQEQRNRAQDEEDSLTSTLNMANYKTVSEATKKQAIAENWPAAQYESAQELND
ncbi:unnamed protein product, partial [marine sediment metagenome]